MATAAPTADVQTTHRGHRLTEVAVRLGVSERTVYRWVAAGQLRVYRLPGGQVRVTEDEVLRIERGEAQ